MFKNIIHQIKTSIEKDKQHKERLYERFINGDYIAIFNEYELGNMYDYEKNTMCYLNDKNIFLKDETNACTWTRYRVSRKHNSITYNPFHNADDTDYNQAYYPSKEVIEKLCAKDEKDLTDLEKHIIAHAKVNRIGFYIIIAFMIVFFTLLQYI